MILSKTIFDKINSSETAFSTIFGDTFRLEIVIDAVSGKGTEYVGADVYVKFNDSMSNRFGVRRPLC